MKQSTTKKKLMALLLALCMVFGTSMTAFAGNGPTSGKESYAWVRLYSSEVNEEGYPVKSNVLYSNSGTADTVEGAVYDKSTNTITLTNYNCPDMLLSTNEMGDDLKLRLIGENHIQSLVVWGFGWGGNLEIIGDGSLTVNENKKDFYALRFIAEGTQGLLKVGAEATLTAYKGTPAENGEEAYSAAFLGSTSSTVPFQGNLEAALTMTPDSGVEGEYAESETVIYEESYDNSYDNRTLQLATKDNDGKLYGIYFFEADEYSEGYTDVFEIVKLDGLASGNEYLAVPVSQTAGVAWPEGYTKDPEGKTVDATISNYKAMTLLQKDGETFYWGSDKIEFPPEGGEGTPWYSVYKGITDKMEITDPWGNKEEAVIAVPVEGMRNLTTDHKAIPEGYSQVMKKTGTFNYFCTNDVIKAVPVKDPSENPGKDTVKELQSTGETKAKIEFATDVSKDYKLDIKSIEVKKELADKNVKFVADINVLDGNNNVVKISNTKMKIRIALPEDLKGYDKYEVVYIVNDEIKETLPAAVENGYIVFETNHLSQYGIVGTNTGNGAKSPQTGDNSNLALWFAVLFISGGVLTVLGITNKKKKSA